MNKDHQIDNFVSLIKKLHKQQNYKLKSSNHAINKTIHQIKQQKQSVKYPNCASQKFVRHKQVKLFKSNEQHCDNNQHNKHQVKSSRNYVSKNHYKSSKFYEDNENNKNNLLIMCEQTNQPLTVLTSPKIFRSSKQYKNQQIPVLSPKNTILQFVTPAKNRLKFKTQQLYNKDINQCLNTHSFLSTQTCTRIRIKTNISDLSLEHLQSSSKSNIKKIRINKYNKYCINLLNKYKESYDENKEKQQNLRNILNNTDNIQDKLSKQINDQSIVTKIQNINRLKIINNKQRLLAKFRDINAVNNTIFTKQNHIQNQLNNGDEVECLQSKQIQNNDGQKYEMKETKNKIKTQQSVHMELQQKYRMKTKLNLEAQRTLPNNNTRKVMTISQHELSHSHYNPEHDQLQNYHYTQTKQTGRSNMPLSHTKTKSKQKLDSNKNTQIEKGEEANIKIQGWNVHNQSRNNNDNYVRNYCYEGEMISRSGSIYGRSLDFSY